MNHMTNCPNCGAVITGPKCEYCGTVFRTDDTVTLKLESKLIAEQIMVQELYDSALRAMRAYAGRV